MKQQTHTHTYRDNYEMKAIKVRRWRPQTEASERAGSSPDGPPVTSDQLHTFHSAQEWPYMEQGDKITAMEPCIHLLFLDDMSDGG